MLAPKLDASLEKTQIGLGWFITQRNNIDYAYHMGGIRGYD